MQIEYTIEHNHNGIEYCFDATFEGYPVMTSDSFSYAGTHCTGGRDGVCELPAYATLNDGAELVKDGLTEDEIDVARSWLNNPKNQKKVDDEICEQWESNLLDY